MFIHLSQQIRPVMMENQETFLKRVYRPIELKLTESGLKVVKNSFTIGDEVRFEDFDKRQEYQLKGKNVFPEIAKQPQQWTLLKDNLTVTTRIQNNQAPAQAGQINIEREHYHLGLLNSLLYNSNEKYQKEWKRENQDSINANCLGVFDSSNRIRIMICVTVYSEKLQELEKSMQGITQSLDSFLEQGFLPHQIGVTVIFDGIANVCNQEDETSTSYHSNVINYFQTKMDKKFGVRKEKTLAFQYNNYVTQMKRLNDYKPENISYLRAHKAELLKKYESHRSELLATMKQLNGHRIWTEADEYIEQNIVNAMMEQHKRAQLYLANRKNTAWVYQDRFVHQKSGGSMPIFYVFKYSNGSKLSSHMWFFEGFCKELNPDYCVLMDVGASPAKDAIFKLIMAMEADKKVGGVCGTMRIENEKEEQKIDVELDIFSHILINKIFSIQKCQSCEYDIAHLLDKQAESALDFIHVLPGAFSAYRYHAFFYKHNDLVQNQGNDNRYVPIQHQDSNVEDNSILRFYLRQVLEQNYEHQTIQEANMFLAEDRVLCQRLFCQGYYLRYIPDSIVYVDACTTLKMLQLQRRRWINGSWYALNYVADNYRQDLAVSGHSTCDKLMFVFSITQARIQQLMIYIMESFQIVWLYMILFAIVKTGDEGLDNFIISTIIAFYVFLLFTIIYLAINYDPALIGKLRDDEKGTIQKRETDYYFRKFQQISTYLGFISLATVAYTIYLLITEIFINSGFQDFIDKPHVPQSYYFLLIALSIAMMVLPVLTSIFMLPQNIMNVISTMIPYFYYQPTYSHLFVVYSFCRIDDLSWGTKGLTVDAGSNSITSDKAYQKYLFLLKWVLVNTIITAVLLILFQINVFLLPQGIILTISVILTILTILKGFMALYYRFKYSCSIKKKIKKHINIEKDKMKEVEAKKARNQKATSFSESLQKFYSNQK